MDLLTYSSILAAVDPVAVLAIFQEIGVNMSLYFLVFGESLLNDGVTVVLYNTMISLNDEENEHELATTIGHTRYILAILSFLTVVIGGLSIGILLGMVSSFIVKFARHVREIEPLVILVVAYFSYILAETIHWSGIISLIGCGLAQRRYAFLNISKKSHTTVKYSVKTLSTFSDCIIFLYLGIVTFSEKQKHQWHWELVIWTIMLCTVFRFVGVIIFTGILNTTRVYKISFKEQFIIGYGGLRGAVGFSLAATLREEYAFKNLFITATLAIVYFTVFIQGSTMKFFVRKLNIKTKNDSPKQIFDYIHDRTTDQIMAGIEAILGGFHGHMCIEKMKMFDDRYTKKLLIHRKAEHDMTLRFQQIALDEHYARLYGPSILVHQNKVNLILRPESLVTLSLEEEAIGGNRSSATMANGCAKSEITRKLLLEAFHDTNGRGKLRKSRRLSIHPDIMCQQINSQRERARSICLAAITDVPLSDVPEEEHSIVQQNGVTPSTTNVIQANGKMEILSVRPQNIAMNGEQLRKAYKRTQLHRQNTNDRVTRL